MPPDDDELAKVQRIVYIVYLAAAIVGTVWYMYELEKEDPLGWPASVRSWWEQRQRERLRRHRERIDAGNLVIETALFLERLREGTIDG